MIEISVVSCKDSNLLGSEFTQVKLSLMQKEAGSTFHLYARDIDRLISILSNARNRMSPQVSQTISSEFFDLDVCDPKFTISDEISPHVFKFFIRHPGKNWISLTLTSKYLLSMVDKIRSVLDLRSNYKM